MSVTSHYLLTWWRSFVTCLPLNPALSLFFPLPKTPQKTLEIPLLSLARTRRSLLYPLIPSPFPQNPSSPWTLSALRTCERRKYPLLWFSLGSFQALLPYSLCFLVPLLLWLLLHLSSVSNRRKGRKENFYEGNRETLKEQKRKEKKTKGKRSILWFEQKGVRAPVPSSDFGSSFLLCGNNCKHISSRLSMA